MVFLQTTTLEHTPSSHSVHISLFRNIKNASFLLEQLRSGNVEYEYALIDARVIATAFLNFGITAQTRDLVIVKVGDLALHDSINDHLSQIIEGEAEEFSDDTLENITDWTIIHKLYSVMEKRQLQKLENKGGLKKAERTEIELLIIGAMALKGLNWLPISEKRRIWKA